MRVLICAGIFPPDIGGPATFSKILAKELKGRGHEVKVLAYSDRKERDNYSFEVQRVKRSWFKPWHYLKYFWAAKQMGSSAQIFYAQDTVSAGYPTYLAAKSQKKPYVVKVTGDYSWEQATGRGLTEALIDEFQALKEYPKRIRRIRDIQIQVCKSADLVITPSEYLKRLVAGWGVPEKRIKVIYNAIELPQIKLGKAELRERYRISSDAFLIVSAGRPVKWKGFELLKDVVDELSNSMELDTVRIQLKILQNLPRSEMLEMFAAADAFVLNTGYEGFAHSVLEAMACGLPVITTDLGGNPEIVQDGYNGLLIEYNNKESLKAAILKLYKNPGLRAQFSQNAARSLEKFTLLNMIEQTEQTLAQTVHRYTEHSGN